MIVSKIMRIIPMIVIQTMLTIVDMVIQVGIGVDQ